MRTLGAWKREIELFIAMMLFSLQILFFKWASSYIYNEKWAEDFELQQMK